MEVWFEIIFRYIKPIKDLNVCHVICEHTFIKCLVIKWIE
jgi:hypothetical protein